MLRKSSLALTALVVLFGLQTLRLFFPLILFILRDRFGANSVQVGLYALIVFALGAGFGVWALGSKGRTLHLTAGGLAVLRLAAQLWWGDPLLDLVFISFGIVFFFAALPLCLRDGALGLPLGLMVDSALHGACQSYDLGWRHELPSALVMGFLCLGALMLLRGQPLSLPKPVSSGALFALGPFFFLQLLVFGNLARLTALSEWAQPAAFAWILLTQTAALGFAFWLTNGLRSRKNLVVLSLTLLLVGSLLLPWPNGVLAPFCLLLGQLSSVGLLIWQLNRPDAAFQRVKIAASYGFGTVTLVGLTFLYYASYDFPIPFSNGLLAPAAGLLLGMSCMLCGPRSRHFERTCAGLSTSRVLAATSLFFLLPAIQLSTRTEPRFAEYQGGQVRMMSYNLHNGFDPQGHLGLEALAQAIEAEAPDVVALQEVSRGWVVYGSLDMLPWLSQRLDMPFVYGPTSDPLWGNALLSRYPMREVQKLALPPRDLPLKRGLIRCQIEWNGEPLQVLATHFDHRRDGGEARQTQARRLLEFSRTSPRTVLLGDFNAQPHTPEIELLKEAGFHSVGPSSALTFPSYAPEKKIDYIWLSSDLQGSDFSVSPAQASDHFGLAITISPPEQPSPK